MNPRGDRLALRVLAVFSMIGGVIVSRPFISGSSAGGNFAGARLVQQLALPFSQTPWAVALVCLRRWLDSVLPISLF